MQTQLRINLRTKLIANFLEGKLRLVPVFSQLQKSLWMLSILLLATNLFLPTSAHAGSYDDLITAVKFDYVEVVQDLLVKGIDPNSVEPGRGETILMLALREHSDKVFNLLMAQPEIKIEARANNGDTAIMIASYEDNIEAVKKLIAADAQINQPGWTALHYAAVKGNLEIISLLLEHSAYIDTESPNKTTPLMIAVRSGKSEAITLLLDEGADATVKNQLGMTALDFALKYEKKEIAEILKEHIKKHH